MPQYYFQVRVAGTDKPPPDDPIELLNVDAAWEEATATLRDLLQGVEHPFAFGTELTVLVQDESRRTLRSITVSSQIHDQES